MEKQRTPPAGAHRTPVFSEDLQDWLHNSPDKTLASLSKLFEEKTFAIAFMLLMALPALPIPTGGITHITEIITMLLSLELVAGRKTIWLPKRWQDVDVGKALKGKATQRLIIFITWFERLSRQRWSSILLRTPLLSLVGVIVFLLSMAAFVAPPFSGLDTLPSLGVVIISLALILEDSLILLAGIIIGAAGVGLEITVGAALYDGFKHLL